MTEQRKAPREIWILLLLAVIGYFMFFHHVGLRYIWSPDEDEYTLVNREMVEDGHWIFPTVNGTPYSIKPPFFNWIGSGISVLAGEVTEGTSRMPSPIAALVGLFVVYGLGRLLFGRRAGFLAALVLAATPLYIEFARWTQINMISTVLLSMTLLCFWWGYTFERRRTRAYLLMYIPVGIGVLNMGLVNVAMPTIVLGLFLLANRDLKHLFRLKPILGILIALAVAAPWYAIVSTRPGYAENLLFTTNLTRYFGTFAHAKPWHYYFKTTLPYFLPWTLLLPGAVVAFVREKDREEKQRILFPIVWAVSLFVFFSASKTKRSEYLLPIFPALALLAGYVLDRGFTGWRESPFWRKSVVWPLGSALVGCLVVAVGLPVYCAAAEPDWLLTIIPIGIMVGLGGGAGIFFLRQRRGTAVVLSIVLATAGAVAYGAGAVVSRVNDVMSPRSFCAAVADTIADQEMLLVFNWYSPAYGYYTRKKFDLTMDPNQLVEWMTSDKRTFVLMKEKDYRKVEERLALEMHVVHRQWVDHRWVLLVSNRPKER